MTEARIGSENTKDTNDNIPVTCFTLRFLNMFFFEPLSCLVWVLFSGSGVGSVSAGGGGVLLGSSAIEVRK